MADKNEKRVKDIYPGDSGERYQRYSDKYQQNYVDKCQRYTPDKYQRYNIDKCQRYECYEAYLLYEEFLNIPDNRVKLRIPEGMMLTCNMMRTFLKVAYVAKGIGSIFEM